MKFLNKHKGKIFILIFITFTAFTIYDTYSMETETDSYIKTKSEITKKETTKEEKPKENKVLVDVKGEVNTPSVYELTTNNTVIDAINKAGGLTKVADTSNLNLSKKLEDEMVIIVYSKEEIKKKIEYVLAQKRYKVLMQAKNGESLSSQLVRKDKSGKIIESIMVNMGGNKVSIIYAE